MKIFLNEFTFLLPAMIESKPIMESEMLEKTNSLRFHLEITIDHLPAVLPEPVSAIPITSRFCKPIGMACR